MEDGGIMPSAEPDLPPRVCRIATRLGAEIQSRLIHLTNRDEPDVDDLRFIGPVGITKGLFVAGVERRA